MTQHTYDVETVVVHGHRRAYVKTGSGPALLLLHGLGCDHHTWDPVLSRLSKHFTVIAPDMLGHGDSANTASPATPTGCATCSRCWASRG